MSARDPGPSRLAIVRPADPQRTQFGMPQINPLGPNAAAGAATSQFGEEDLARLAQAAREEGLVAEPTPMASLLAGLPRPRVSSAPSPLTTGGSPFDEPVNLTPSREAPSARSTVMGMPVLARPSQAPRVVKVAAEEAPEADARPQIQSMADLDLGQAATEAPSGVPAAAPSAAERAPEPTPGPPSESPGVQRAPAATPEPARAPAEPRPAPAARTGPTPVEASSGAGLGALKIIIALAVLAAGAWFAYRALS